MEKFRQADLILGDSRYVFLFLFVENFCILDNFVSIFTNKKHFLMYESLISLVSPAKKRVIIAITL